nr:hypothetical protein [Tanacetum cinerariifolium]
SHHTPTVTQPSTSSQPQQKQKSKKSKKRVTKIPQLSDSTHDVANEHVTTTSNDPLLKTTKADQALEIESLKRRVKKLEKKADKKFHKLKSLYKIGRMFAALDDDEGVALVDETQGRNDQDMFDTSIFYDKEVVAEKEDSTADPVHTAGEVVTTAGVEASTSATTAGVAKGIVMQESSETPTTTPKDTSQQSSKAKYKGKAKMFEPEKPLKSKDQIMIDEEDNTQAMMDTDYELATRLQEEERGELTIKEKSRLFVELMDKRKKHFARLRAEKIRSKPPTKTQKWNQMCTYLKNMKNYKHNQLKNKSFKEIQMLFNNNMNSKRAAREKLEQEDAKRQWIEEENESAKLKRCLEIVPDDDDDVTIEATPLSSKSPTIVDYKIYQDGRKSFFKIIRADGNSQNYLTFRKMFKNFNREDLEGLWSIIKARF